MAVDCQARQIINQERAKRDIPYIKAEHIEIAAQLRLGASSKEMKIISIYKKGS